MYKLSAFVSIPTLVSNQPGVDSPLGELSATAKTYSREVGTYKTLDHPNTILNAFHSAQDGTLTVVPANVVSALLSVAEFLYNRAIDGTLSDDKEACRQLLLTRFGGTVQFNLVGRMVTNGTYWLPETITVALIGQGDNEIRLWFSDPAFRTQYDHYEIVVVPPVEPLDDLHGQRAVVLTKLAGLTIAEHLTKVNRLIGSDPQTYLITHEYDWTDKNDPSVKKSTPWTVIVYGVGGNNDDIIREALVAYILANSQFPRSEWEKLYPDLFLPLEFYVTPLWDRYSLPNMLTTAGVYSPTVSWKDAMSYALGTFYGQTFQHCSEYLSVSQTTYKSLAFVTIGNSRNRNNIFDFGTLWGDYASLSTTNTDFGRMSLLTQQFTLLLTQALIHAESMTSTSAIPEGFSRVKRGEYWYLAKTFNKVLYLFWLKVNDFPEVEVPELPNFSQYRLTLSVTGAPGSQTITGVVSQDGTPGPINSAIPIDWYVSGDWFTTELQDGDSTQSIPAVVTNSESGSATHTVRVEFMGSVGPVALTGQVQLAPAPVATDVLTLDLSYGPGQLLYAKLLKDGQPVADNDYDVLGSTLTFIAEPIPGITNSGVTIETTLTEYALVFDQSPRLVDGVRAVRTVRLNFTHADNREISLVATIPTPTTTWEDNATIDWSFDNFVDTNQVEHTLWAANVVGGQLERIVDTTPTGGLPKVQWELWMNNGTALFTDFDEAVWKPDLVFSHTNEVKAALVLTVRDGETVKRIARPFTWAEFTAWQN